MGIYFTRQCINISKKPEPRKLEKKNKKGRYRLIGQLPFIKCKKTIEIYRHFFVGYEHQF